MGTMREQCVPKQARATFGSLFGHSYEARCVFASFSAVCGFRGRLAFADPPLADAELLNADEVRGNICVIRRGGCSFFDKARRAASAGASAIIFVNNVDDVFFAECEGVPCSIPSVTVPLAAYERLADLRKCAPLAWYAEVDPDGKGGTGGDTPSDLMAAGKKLRLFATVVKATGLRAADGDTDLCPFVEITCGDCCRRTRTHYGLGGTDLLWNQRLSFKLSADTTSIAVRCQDEESPCDAALVGENVSVSLDQLMQFGFNAPFSLVVPLTNSYGAAAGSVHLEMQLDICKAQPPSSAVQGRGIIEVLVQCAENVPPPSKPGEKGSPFLKVKVGAITKRTPAFQGTHAMPVWNHKMRFLMPRARPGCAPLVALEMRMWDECRVGHVPMDCDGELSLPALRSKGDVWEGWADLRGSSGEAGKTRVKLTVTCVETPQAVAGIEKGGGTVARGLLDADLALFYMMLSAFVIAVPPLRALVLWVILPALLTTTAFLLLLVVGGILVKRRVLVSHTIKYALGAVLGSGHYVQARRRTSDKACLPRDQFVSDVSLQDGLSIYDLYGFFCSTGKLTLSRVGITQPAGWQEGEKAFFRAERVHIDAVSASIWSRNPIVNSITVQKFELNVSVKDGMESNLKDLARTVEASLASFSRIFGKVEGGVKCVKFEEGTVRVAAHHFGKGWQAGVDVGKQEPLVVSVDRIDLSDVGRLNPDSDGEVSMGLEAAVNLVTFKLLEAVAESQRTRSAVNMYLSLDPEAVWQGIGEDEDADVDLEQDLGDFEQADAASSAQEAFGDEGPEHIAF